MPKISRRKPILFELLYLNLKRKNNIKNKILWVWQVFMGRHSKENFHLLVKELKLFYYEFFFKQIATRNVDFSQRYFRVFVLLKKLLHSAISSADNTIE